ncbi:MAG: adenine methyltransferase [Kiritimatiellae bacterium]|nr:adenine methyltransferase [Kiritimatiellia bacterium]
MINSGMFTSNTDLWATPQDFFDNLNAEFKFETDVCALPENAKCAHFFTPEQNGLDQEWRGVCWMNPPYGRDIVNWVRKAYESAQKWGTTVVCLVPARTDTAWWHDYCMKGEYRFVRGRLKFGGCKNSAPFPSAVVIFRGTQS